uniref:Uncharacterized protein n=1 Tax=Abalone asfa-like virus TaxID=2839893 RepID=A0A5K7XYH8_9VIRU|nr:hypothetical protein [Abalone asfa-like virus]
MPVGKTRKSTSSKRKSSKSAKKSTGGKKKSKSRSRSGKKMSLSIGRSRGDLHNYDYYYKQAQSAGIDTYRNGKKRTKSQLKNAIMRKK